VVWGERVGREAARPLVLALRGDLGAGKSVLARAVARGAGVQAPMPSPTFNLVCRYAAERGSVLHLDLYRLERMADVWELGWRELGDDDEIVLVEWAERVEPLLPERRWDVRLDPVPGDSTRRELRAEPHGYPPALPLP
jgi:tRNA threonylcarbamoyladenosine biosynthesis protein TsaE